jgi:hypothetical protein
LLKWCGDMRGFYLKGNYVFLTCSLI